MVRNGIGGANTQTGIMFEQKVDLATYLNNNIAEYNCIEKKYKKLRSKSYKIYYKGNLVAQTFQKYSLYAFLEERNIKWKDILSKQLLPDDCVYIIKNNTVFIIEIKFQKVNGSIDEKLQTCDFKKKQYKKLFAKLNYDKVEYIYVLSDFYKAPKYQDILNYIHSMGCDYYFQYLPLSRLGLPISNEK